MNIQRANQFGFALINYIVLTNLIKITILIKSLTNLIT